jgi:hypothetical protein
MKMNGRILLDTNIVIAVFSGEESIQRYIEKANEIFIPVIVIGELYFGAYNSMNMERNIEKIDEFVANSTILSCDAYTAKIYGKIKGDFGPKPCLRPVFRYFICLLSSHPFRFLNIRTGLIQHDRI